MTRRFALSMLGAIVCIAWAVLTAWAFIHGATRRDDDVPATYPEPWDESVPLAYLDDVPDVQPTVTLTTAPSVTVRLGDNLTTSDAAGLVWFDWRSSGWRDGDGLN